MDRLSRDAFVGVLVLVLAPVVVAIPARADTLHVATVAGLAWPDVVEALQRDLHAQGRTVALVAAGPTGDRLPCGRYELVLDATATRAFTAGACDAITGSTPVTLVNRSALFGHGQVVPRPLAVGVTAEPVTQPENASLVWPAGHDPDPPSVLPPSSDADGSEQSPTRFVRSRVSCAGGLLDPSLLTFLGPDDARAARVIAVVSVPAHDVVSARSELRRVAVAACADAVSDVVVDAGAGRVVALALRMRAPSDRSR